MSIKAIVDDIHAHLCTIDAAFAAAQPTSRLGGEFMSENAAPPRVVWVPLRAAPGIFDPRGTTPRAFGMARHVNVACHIWGADDDSADTLLNEVHNAARRSLGAGARWLSEDWPQKDGDVIADYGTLVVVVFEFRIPITEVQQTTVKVTDPNKLTQTVQADFPGSSVSGSPAP
jgi:hypothetical protein